MPIKHTRRTIERKEAMLKLLADGCKTTAYILRTLGLTHTEAYYTLELLKNEGHIIKIVLGKTAIWCLNNEEYNKTVGELLQEIQRIVETHNLRYVYPVRLYRLILKDRKAYVLISKFVSMNHSNTAVLAFLNHLLKMLYGNPYFEGEKVVYLAVRNTEPQKPTT